MKITDLLKKEGIRLHGSASSKRDAIDQMVELMVNTGNITDPATYREVVLAREEEGTTGVGEGIAIPHGKTKAVQRPGLSAMVLPDGVDFESLDHEPVDLIFLIAAPDTEDNVHLEVLSQLSVLLMNPEFTTSLRNAATTEEFLRIIDEAENGKREEASQKEKAPQAAYEILAVTACPTGIAHTYMAAESLENKGKELGHPLKAETNGSGGAKNILTPQEIAECSGIIIAADKNVEMARFDGKPVLLTSVSRGINDAEALIQKVVNKEVPVYHHTGEKDNSMSGEKESIGRKIYKNLMNGVSHMLPFVVGGGILIALAFIFDDYAINPQNFGMNTPLAAFFKTIGSMAFSFMLPVLSGFIAMSIADRPGLAVGFVGGALASGGYTFANLLNYSDSTPVSSGFLGALFAGFVAGYLVVLLRKLFDKLPKSFEGIKLVLLFPFFGVLLIGAIMLLVNPFVGAVNEGLNTFLSSLSGTSQLLLGAVLAGMMAIDMGGPFNKAAYVFGTAQLTVANAGTEQFQIMAAVMIGGMVPPLAIALCTTFFKNRFTENERKSGVANYIMGLSFITEGAIPFAAADPLRVLPSCIVGSAVAGALSMLFQCGSRAPHGGIFVIAVIEHPLYFLLALLIGSIISMFLLAVLKKPIHKKTVNS
ncbi:MAG: fructose-specific PTS transporter subunit EIIC [Lachnospiraceae bacterium]